MSKTIVVEMSLIQSEFSFHLWANMGSASYSRMPTGSLWTLGIEPEAFGWESNNLTTRLFCTRLHHPVPMPMIGNLPTYESTYPTGSRIQILVPHIKAHDSVWGTFVTPSILNSIADQMIPSWHSPSTLGWAPFSNVSHQVTSPVSAQISSRNLQSKFNLLLLCECPSRPSES